MYTGRAVTNIVYDVQKLKRVREKNIKKYLKSGENAFMVKKLRSTLLAN